MRKVTYWMLAAALLVGAVGCSKKEQGQEQTSKLAETIVSEDFQPGNEGIMKTETGYYYFDASTLAFRYYDIATGKDMYLCNKPECKHDGSAFCVASIAKRETYSIGRFWLYSNRIFAEVVEETDTQYLFKLLEIAIDGSEMNEYTTYMSMEKAGQVIPSTRALKLFIHRNKVILPMVAYGKDVAEDVYYYGTAILDLDTREVTYLDEEPLSKDNLEVQGISAYEDYIYYYKKEGRKNVLHRYNITNGTDESYTLQPGFNGNYVVFDEDNIVYQRSMGNALYVYHPSTKQTEEVAKLARTRPYNGSDGSELEMQIPCNIKGMTTDGTYLYASDGYAMIKHDDGSESEENYVFVLNQNFEVVTYLNMAEMFPAEMLEKIEVSYINQSLHYLGEEIYFEYVTWNSQNPKTAGYKCNRSDFLNGTPEFEHVFGAELQ